MTPIRWSIQNAHIVTDCIIAVIIYFTIGTTYTCIKVLRFTKRKRFFLIILIFLNLTLTIFFGYSSIIEPNILVINNRTIDIKDYKFEEKTKLILISDLHVGRFYNSSRVSKVVEKINEQKEVKYVLILGDIVNHNNNHLDTLDPLRNIDSGKEVFFIYGNHDYDYKGMSGQVKDQNIEIVEGLTQKIEDLGIRILNNESIIIEKENNQRFVLAGVQDYWSNNQDYTFLNQLEKEDTVILMCHNPDCLLDLDSKKNEKENVDLVVTGHTHGGEMRLPVIGSISPVGLPIQLPQEYDQGYHTYNDTPLFITSGLGTVGVRMRSFNPPEIVILTIK